MMSHNIIRRSANLSAVLFAFVLILDIAQFQDTVHAAEEAKSVPKVLDDRLKLELFAAEPDIVTPTGITVDSKGRILAIENNTHFRPKDYDGPAHDRIRCFEDTNNDGRADKITTFYENSTDTMSVKLAPDGSIIVASRNEIFKLFDKDNDGKADEKISLIKLKSEDTYPHSGLAGLTFSDKDELHFGLGENHAMPFTLTGTDGIVLKGIEGGHVYRCQLDGSKLARVSIGCWNPHAMEFDAAGRLFAVDNDPDSLPPCRLLHIVEGGDYGYKYRNGRRGSHPYTAWNGELPDTLPIISGTGEAPSGIVVCAVVNKLKGPKLPADYANDLLITSWGDHRIERYRLAHKGASVTAERIDVVIGDEDFRPVGITTGGDGAIYFTDWVKKDYTIHKHGRIWKLSTVKPNDLPKPNAKPKLTKFNVEKSSDERRADNIRTVTVDDDKGVSREDIDISRAAQDPFFAQAIRRTTLTSGFAATLATDPKKHDYLKSASAAERLGVLCAFRELNTEATRKRAADFLTDPDPGIRLVALKWIGEEKLDIERKDLDKVLTAGQTTSRLFAAYIATLEKLDQKDGAGNRKELSLDEYVAAALIAKSTPPEARRWALRTVKPTNPAITSNRMRYWLAGNDALFQLEAVRTLRDSSLPDRDALLWGVIESSNSTDQLRAEATVGIRAEGNDNINKLISLTASEDQFLAQEALRSLRGAKLDKDQQQKLEDVASSASSLSHLIARAFNPQTSVGMPDVTDTDAWLKKLEGSADKSVGERVFFHPNSAGCARCHQLDGRGATIGPDLTTTARALDRRRLVESILQPSKEIAPQYVNWTIEMKDGKSLSGIYLGEKVFWLPKNDAETKQLYIDATGKEFTLAEKDIDQRTASALSVMPNDLHKQMTLQEFRDLLAFLQNR